ncbi:Craniofacial development protein 2 [Blattella germanica]|nr:Craniofacial development protein 2 [Blattella germanica]
MATWNVKGLKEVGALNNLKSIMQKNKLGILAVQEMGWKGEGIMRSSDFTVFYKGGQRYLFGTGFIVNNIWKNSILKFTGFHERITTLRLKATFLI